MDITTESPNSNQAAVTSEQRRQQSDAECRARATDFLSAVIGSPPDDLRWDEVHHLQGHAHVDGHELVVIAGRDEAHRPVVLTALDWAEIRRDGHNRRAVLEERAIPNRARLLAALANDALGRVATRRRVEVLIAA
ncbi:MAG: hypothetical protein AB7Q42_13855 [Acidimicrobiia bacterium]